MTSNELTRYVTVSNAATAPQRKTGRLAASAAPGLDVSGEPARSLGTVTLTRRP
jgi:hypothetical protein